MSEQLTMAEVERIERELAEIKQLQADLNRRREAVLLSNPEYADYLDCYEIYCGDGQELGPRAYYTALEELKAINAEFDQKGADIEALFEKHGKRLEQLERMLAV